ncbi:MAG: endonuclease III, partial [Eggerthellaceae bacterium]|nr:endonuclease III [Eggerthellaceae bacterium]
PRESKTAKRARAAEIARLLAERYPEARTELIFDGDPFHLVVAVLLSAQTTDKAVNKVTPVLWERYPTLEDLAGARQEDVEEILRSIGFFRTKAKNVIGCARMVLADFGGEVPRTMEELQRLPGVGRKTANIVTNVAFGEVNGIAVDTHVFRITHLLGLSKAETPSATEQDLLALFPKEAWEPLNHELVMYGREVCIARRPKCAECILAHLCPSCH